jgi:flagellar motor switch protein FliN
MTDTSQITVFRAALKRCLQAVTANIGERKWEVQEESDPVASRAAADLVHVAVTLAGALAGELTLSAAREEAELLHGASPGSGVEAAWLRTVKATAEQLCLSLTFAAGEVLVASCRLKPTNEEAHSLGAVVLRSHDEYTAVTIACSGDDVLMRRLREPAADRAAAVETGLFRPAPIDRVIDVQLAVTMRFGQRQLLLRQLLELSAGSLLELDRQVEEPVDLILGDRVIARGEVVIVDGNYGMRITEVVEHAKRIAGREWPQPLSYARA